MGVPDEVEGPVRKRPRLALRTSRKSEPLDTMSCLGDSTPYKSEDTFPSSVSSKSTAPNEYVSVTPDLPSSSDPLVPPVASLYNLGNTCFMNSILEVLRYTPGFVEGIEKLNLEIEEESEEEPSNDLQIVWQVVKSTHQLYSDMEAREKQYINVATCDASSMAVKPTALLNKIRELNPMFEGHYQHDAQELLRCLLCFIEDAHKGLLAIREKRREKMVLKREESLCSKEDLPKCDVENQHSCLATASIKVEPESGMVLKGGSTDSQSVIEAKTRAQSRKLNSGESKNLIDSCFNLKTDSIGPAGICSPANISPSIGKMKNDHIGTCGVISRKRKREWSKSNGRVEATDNNPQIHSADMVGGEVESVHPCRREHDGHIVVKGECSASEIKTIPCHDKQCQPSIDSMFSPVNSLKCSGSLSDKVVKSASLTSDAKGIAGTGPKSPIKNLVSEDTKKGNGCPANSNFILKEETVIDFQNSEYTTPCASESTSLHSVHDVDYVEDILDAHDSEMANIDLTIESVTKGYCSSLPESPSKSSAPSPVMFNPGPTQLVVVSPDSKAANDGGDCSNFFSAGKEAHVILHSPFKPEASVYTPGDEPNDFEQPKCESCVKKLFPTLNNELPEPAMSLFADAMASPVSSIMKRSVSSSSLPALTTQPASTWQQTPPVFAESTARFTSTDVVKDNSPPIKELKMQLKKCDWLGVSPVKSVSARLAISALAKSNTPDSEAAKRLIFTDEITVNKSPPHSKSEQPASSRRSARRNASAAKTISRTNKEHVACPGSVLLKPLSICLDKCDWLLSMNNTVDVKKAMLTFKGNTNQKPERMSQALISQGEAVRERKLMQYSGTLVEHLFGGTMMHRTKCLECELAKERQEVFMDISVPIKSLQTSDVDSDDDNEDNKDFCLDKLMLAFSNIERLKENNKYFCEECNHYVEAERSCHYTTLPLVLTLHLKRFGSNKGLLGGVSKLNDKVIISQHLACLHYMCKQNCQDISHRYSLYGIVTHSGSILSGHYRAYVKVQKSVNPDVFASLKKGNCRTDPTMATADCSFSEPPPVPENERSFTVVKDLAPDREYCRKSLGSVSNTTATPTGHVIQRSKYFPEAERSSGPSSVWLECDDECVRVMEEKDFLSRLEEGDGRAVLGTPYILFYHSLTLV